MPQIDFGVRVAMVLLVVVLLITVFVYHVWLDRIYQREMRGEKARSSEAERVARR
jgi:uncharacterized membrane protein